MRRTRVLVVSVAVGATAVLGAPVAMAQSTAEYTGTGDQGSSVLTTRTPPRSAPPSTLPFTGGELVLVALSGSAAVAAGTVMVLSGRRRQSTQT